MNHYSRFFLPGGGSRIVGLFFTLMFACAMYGAPIAGGFATAGAGVLTFATGGANYIDFCPTDPTSPATVPSCTGAAGYGMGDLTILGGFGTFTAVNPTSAGTIKDLVDSGVHPPFTTFPVNVSSTINNYLTLAALPTLNFIGQLFVPQTCAPTATQLCLGGFVLTQSGSAVSVSATINGRVVDTSGNLTDGLFTHIISGQFNDTNIGAVAAAALSPGGIFSNSLSGSVTVTDAAIPEPGTFGLLGGALILIGSFSTRLRRRK